MVVGGDNFFISFTVCLKEVILDHMDLEMGVHVHLREVSAYGSL